MHPSPRERLRGQGRSERLASLSLFQTLHPSNLEGLSARPPDVPLLPLGNDPIGIGDLGADCVFEVRITVEPTTILADLYEPWPDRFNRRVDRDRVIDSVVSDGHELVTGKGHRELGVSGPPT